MIKNDIIIWHFYFSLNISNQDPEFEGKLLEAEIILYYSKRQWEMQLLGAQILCFSKSSAFELLK